MIIINFSMLHRLFSRPAALSSLSLSLSLLMATFVEPLTLTKTYSSLGTALSSSDFSGKGLGYVDVHAHLIHDKFVGREDAIALDCIAKNMDHVIVNGLEPVSNRKILEFSERYSPYMLPALGIYPLDAACQVIYTQEDVDRLKAEGVQDLPAVNWAHEFPPPAKFDVDAEIAFIEQCAREGRIVAIGECGLDKHYLTDERSFQEQQRVLRQLLKIGKRYDLPVILHTRKAEQRVFEMLREEQVTKADFHCFGGKTKLGVQIAQAGYFLSIPSAVCNGDPNSGFKRLVRELPMDQILTETDSPYMGPVKGEDNTPVTVLQSVETIAQIKGLTPDAVREHLRGNFRRLFDL